ncbi:MAG: SurA N-terminal domain-containing protein [Myxococcales bacterium]
MLEQMRKSSQSLLIYVLFGIVIAVFIINFGPQSRGGGNGCDGAMGGDETAAQVAGQTVSAQAFRAAFMLLGGGNQPPQMLKLRRFKETVMDRLIERELLAQEAHTLGYAVDEEDVHKMLLDGRIIGLGIPHTIPRLQKDGVFNYDQFKTFTQFELGLTPDRFVEQQQREMLAARVRDLMRASVKVSPEELKTAFEVKSRQINLEYVRFPSRKYEGEVELTPEEVAAYVKANQAKLKEVFEQRKQMYTDMPQELRVREILIKGKGQDPTTAGSEGASKDGAGDKADDKADGKVASAADDPAARKQIQGVAARIAKGEAFAKVARETSEDADSRAAGGDLGWRRKGTLGLADADEAKLFAAKSGEVVGPFKTTQGAWVLFMPTASRQGTLTLDKVQDDLAEEQVKQQKAVQIAKRHAEAALAASKGAADKTLKDLFPGEAADAAKAKEGDKNKAGKGDGKSAAMAAAVSDARAEETGLFARRGTVIEQLGDSPELAKAAWNLTAAAPLAGPFEIAGSYVVVRLKERKDPDLAEFDKKKGEFQRDAELAKWNDVLTGWVKHRCLEAKSAGKLSVNKSLLKYEDSQEPPAYEPCGDGAPRRPF